MDGERERERERVSRECGALNPKKYQRGPCSLGSGSRLHASLVAKVFEEREREKKIKRRKPLFFYIVIYIQFAAFYCRH